MKEMITVEKEVYDAVLRNSVRVNDLEAENQQLKELLYKCKFELMGHYTEDWSLMIEINNAIGEKK